MLCDDEKAYAAYMNYLDAMERQGKVADPDKAMDAVLDALEASDKTRARQDDRSSAARSINDRFDIADVRRGP
jgi:hypothetical protein